MLKQFAQASTISNSQRVSIVLTTLLFLLFLPAFVGLFYIFRRGSRVTQHYSKYFLLSLIVFCAAVVLYGGIIYIINPIADVHIVDQQAILQWLFICTFIASGIGIFASAVMIIANQLRNQ